MMKKLRRTSQNFVIDSLAFIAFLFLTTTGILMYYILPPGSGHYSKIWGLDRHQWGDIHFWVAILFFLSLALHLFLHWKWIISFFQRRNTEISFRPLLGIVGVLALIAIAISPILTPVTKDLDAQPKRQDRDERIPGREVQPGSTQKQSQAEPETLPEKQVQKNAAQEHQKEEASPDLQDIQGYMTLEMVEEEYGVPVDYLIRKLALPENTHGDLKLGEIRRNYGFTMQEIREVVEGYVERRE